MVILCVVAAAVVTSARARWTDFLPKPFENALYVEGFASYDSDDNTGGSVQSRWDDTFFKEQVTLFSRGYFYHPRFLRYTFSLSGALKQENYEASDAAHLGWMKGTGIEYEARLLFLAEHPYNLELFALRYEPLYREQSATRTDSVETSNGAQFRYRGKPYFFHAVYLDNTTSSSLADANVKRLAADGQYFKAYAGGNQLSLNAFANESRFTGAGGLDGDSRDYGAGGFFDVTQARVNASATKSTSSQDSPLSGTFDNDRFSFYELLTVYLPVQFRTELSYRILDNTNTTVGGNGAGASELSETSKEFRFDLIHRLYESLDSRYTFLRSDRDSTQGDSRLTAHALDFLYNKTIRRGRVTAGAVVSRADSDNTGRTDVVSEAHPGTTVPGPFLLFQHDVDLGRPIDVSLPSPIAPNPIVHLVEGIDFAVTPVGNTVRIDVLPLGPPFVNGDAYDISVTYSLLSGDFELRTSTYSFNASVACLDNLLTPYFEYVAVRSDVVSGVFPGTSLDSTTTTLGLTFLDGPWRATGEYEELDWAVSPYQALRGEVQYVGAVGPSTRINATAAYLHRHYPTGTSSYLPDPYTDQNTTVSASVQQDFLARSMTLAAGATYLKQQGRVHGDALSLNASLNWRVGKLDLSAGASGYGSETQAYAADPYSRVHQFYYFRIRREFSR
jgi:hypothetical protein